MVLEILLNPKIEQNNKFKFLIIGAVYTIFACFLATLFFTHESGIVSMLFIILMVAPFMYHMLEREEIKQTHIQTKKGLIEEYKNIVIVIFLLFLGITIGYIAVYIYDPSSELFRIQNQQIGLKETPTLEHFDAIFFQNARILLLCVIFAFFFSFGAIFIITFNASLLGTAIGKSIILALNDQNIFGFFMAFIKYVPHGIFEMSAYFLAGIAGSFISFGIIHKEYLSKTFKHTIQDAFFLFYIALILIVIGVFIEVTVSPFLFHL